MVFGQVPLGVVRAVRSVEQAGRVHADRRHLGGQPAQRLGGRRLDLAVEVHAEGRRRCLGPADEGVVVGRDPHGGRPAGTQGGHLAEDRPVVRHQDRVVLLEALGQRLLGTAHAVGVRRERVGVVAPDREDDDIGTRDGGPRVGVVGQRVRDTRAGGTPIGQHRHLDHPAGARGDPVGVDVEEGTPVVVGRRHHRVAQAQDAQWRGSRRFGLGPSRSSTAGCRGDHGQRQEKEADGRAPDDPTSNRWCSHVR